MLYGMVLLHALNCAGLVKMKRYRNPAKHPECVIFVAEECVHPRVPANLRDVFTSRSLTIISLMMHVVTERQSACVQSAQHPHKHSKLELM